MTQMTSMGPLKVLGHVTLIVAVPLLAGAIAGIIIDSVLGTAPLWILSGFAAGNLIAAIGIWLYIRRARPRSARPRNSQGGTDQGGSSERSSERP